MENNFKARPTKYMRLTARVVGAYVSNNHVQSAELSKLLNAVHATMQAQTQDGTFPAAGSPVAKASNTEIKRSISRDALISFEDGRSYKTLKRHLTTRGLTPERYREKWGLPKDYPMVAPAYAERRSALAKAIGLGRSAQSVARRGQPVVRKGPRRGGPKRAAEAARCCSC
ncbi:MucR family transcriptional regulator [Methylobacterium oryzae CBMB20]